MHKRKLIIYVDPALIEEVDSWRIANANKLLTRSAAIRELLRRGLDQNVAELPSSLSL